MQYVVYVRGQVGEVYGPFMHPEDARLWAQTHFENVSEFEVLPIRRPMP